MSIPKLPNKDRLGIGSPEGIVAIGLYGRPKPMATPETTNSATSVLGTFVVIFLNPKIIKIVANARINSKYFMSETIFGKVFNVPITPEAFFPARVLASTMMSSSVIFSALSMVVLKSSKTKIPSFISSLRIFSKIISSA